MENFRQLKKENPPDENLFALWQEFIKDREDKERRDKLVEELAKIVKEEISKQKTKRQKEFYLNFIRVMTRNKMGLPWGDLPEKVKRWLEYEGVLKRGEDVKLYKKKPVVTKNMMKDARYREWREMRRAGFDDEEYEKFLGNDYP